MATVTDEREVGVTTLHGVTYKTYERLLRNPHNQHLRMAYHDGTLEIMSPSLYAHEGASRRFSLLIILMSKALRLRFTGTGSMTIRRGGDGATEGVGKEPDQGFYFGSWDRFPTHRDLDLGAGDPPPDLWIEVDHRASSQGRLPIYARLGVPEVWQFRVARQAVQFLQLVAGAYVPIDRSLALPVLTPNLVVEAIVAGEEMAESDYFDYLQDWIPAIIARHAHGPQPD